MQMSKQNEQKAFDWLKSDRYELWEMNKFDTWHDERAIWLFSSGGGLLDKQGLNGLGVCSQMALLPVTLIKGYLGFKWGGGLYGIYM